MLIANLSKISKKCYEYCDDDDDDDDLMMITLFVCHEKNSIQ